MQRVSCSSLRHPRAALEARTFDRAPILGQRQRYARHLLTEAHNRARWPAAMRRPQADLSHPNSGSNPTAAVLGVE